MPKTFFFFYLFVFISILFSPPTHAAEVKTNVVKSECTSKGTKPTGERELCYSEWSEWSVPDGYFILKDQLNIVCTNCSGSENRCEHEFHDFVEVIPGTGLEQPTRFKYRAYARSPSGQINSRGWSKCSYTVTYSKYK